MWITVMPVRVVMVLDLLSLMGAYAAGECRDATTTKYTAVLVAAVFIYLVVQMVLASLPVGVHDNERVINEKSRKVLLLLATFATSLTSVAGLSAPGGFWAVDGAGHRAGETVMGSVPPLQHHRVRHVAAHHRAAR
ncbi:hypothetical protein E2562_027704 [Oryza meyeriana var. granulata]|uniref:PGG domain-containing protein n=1 Tax=Oryza meyeriana var. granulata TaxID=110450 RepID=A0A6G1CTK8_9ORYZ|nr:hypothetical protein E2562_027704 [Oryza meyeriana var. granulata]